MGRMMWLCLVCGLSTTPTQAFPQFGAENAAMAVLDAFMMAFNARDDEAMCQTFHYPHVRFAGGSVRRYDTFDDCVEQFDFAEFSARFGWDHSGWDRRTVVQANSDKVHVTVIFSRYDSEGIRLSQFDSLYIVTRIDQRWGIRSRSSFAP
ncbi:MAG: hypothetical protein CL484_13930 [Acidobacteria bacterium]|nr:hypothetical protein [Acidobacteriota bacterium]|tara:strand:+ start:3461 stop:3910 length:450 start_codon:yes stop_codon:yes gene_type:complete